MGILGDVLGGIGDIAGTFSSGGADDAANKFYRDLVTRMQGLNPNITAQTTGPSALGSAGADSRAAQMDALSQLQNISRKGGMDAIGQGQIAQAQSSANRNAMANRNAVQESMRAKGAGRSGVGLALQQAGGQSAMGDANLAASQAAAGAQARQMGAIQGAGALGGDVRGQDYQAAGAQDAVNRFNAMMRQTAQQQSFGNQTGQIMAEGDLYDPAMRAGQRGEARTSRLYSGLGNMLGSVGDYAMGQGQQPKWLQGGGNNTGDLGMVG